MVSHKMGLRSFLYQAKPFVFTLLFFSLVVNLGALVQPFFFLNMSMSVITTRDDVGLYYLILILFFVYACIFLIDFVRYRILNRIVMMLQINIAELVHRAILRHTELNPGVALTQPIGFLTNLRSFLSSSSMLSFLDLPFLPVYFFVIFILEPFFFWYAFLIVSMILLLTYLDHKLTYKIIKDYNSKNGLALNTLNAQLVAAEPVLVMGMKTTLYRRWLAMMLNVLHFHNINKVIYSKISVFTKILRQFMPIGVMGLGAYLSLQPAITGKPLSIFVVITASIVLSRIVSIADGVLAGWKSFVYAVDAYVNLKVLLLPFEVDEPHKIVLSSPISTLHIDSGTYISRNTGVILVNSVSFLAESGQVWAIMGGVGSGKSTIARILLNILPLSQGSLRYNNIDSKSINMQSLGSSIGYLPQDVVLFSGTIAQNIARFKVPIDQISIVEAAELAGISRWIDRLPLGSESYFSISGGQRQQIALARAYYKYPSLLILDEPNANLDEHGEQLLNQALSVFKSKGSLVFVITHRQSVLEVTDHLLIMNQGVMSYAGPNPSSSVLGVS